MLIILSYNLSLILNAIPVAKKFMNKNDLCYTFCFLGEEIFGSEKSKSKGIPCVRECMTRASCAIQKCAAFVFLNNIF